VSEAKPNPFAPPAQTAAPGDKAAGSMQYFDAYQYVFRSPNWIVNLLLVTLCQFIPVIGPMVTMGYQFEIIEALHRDPRRVYPDFSFDLFVDYLKRGLWPFLVSLLVGMVLAVPLTIVIYIVMIAVALLAAGIGGEGGAAFGIIGMPLAILVIMVIAILISVLIIPMVLRAGLAQDFAEAFKFDFVKSFLSLTWKEIFLSALFMAATGAVVVLVGLAIFCIGSYVAASLLMLAQAHIYFQLYQLFLARGGEPIPLQPQTR
jgi:hypothetical protein